MLELKDKVNTEKMRDPSFLMILTEVRLLTAEMMVFLLFLWDI